MKKKIIQTTALICFFLISYSCLQQKNNNFKVIDPGLGGGSNLTSLEGLGEGNKRQLFADLGEGSRSMIPGLGDGGNLRLLEGLGDGGSLSDLLVVS